jgi:hypothetical protein
VKALYTLGSPHAGINGINVILPLLGLLPGSPLSGVLLCGWQTGVCQLSPDNVAEFNWSHWNQAHIQYGFIGGQWARGSGLYVLLLPTEGENDGLIGRKSAVGYDLLARDLVWTYFSPPTRL